MILSAAAFVFEDQYDKSNPWIHSSNDVSFTAQLQPQPGSFACVYSRLIESRLDPGQDPMEGCATPCQVLGRFCSGGILSQSQACRR